MRLALYTTIYPESLPFLQQWSASVFAQTCQEFDLWIALDGVSETDVFAAATRRFGAQFLSAPAQSTPAGVRNYALAVLLDFCDVVVLVDSDDILLPTRVEAALVAAEKNDLTASAMELVDVTGDRLNISFDPAVEGNDIVHGNVFGFSNTTWRSSLLRDCLPASPDCRLMDWLVAVKAHLKGAAVGFDSTPRMLYRQYSGNVAVLVPPFDSHQVMAAARLVLGHYRLLVRDVLPGNPGGTAPFVHAYEEISLFCKVMSS